MTATSVRLTGRPKAASRRARPLILDPKKISDLRRMMGLTTYALAGALATTSSTIVRLERGEHQDVLDLGFVADLARVLGCSVPELLLAPPDAGPSDGTGDDGDHQEPEGLADDAKVVGSMVAAAFGWIAVDDICDTLSWSLDRVLEALHVVETTAPVIGMALAWHGDHVCLVPAHDEPDSVRRRGVRFHYSLQKDPAALLYRLARGDGQELLDRHPQISHRRLIALGLAEFTDASTGPELRLTDDGRFNLCLAIEGTDSAQAG